MLNQPNKSPIFSDTNPIPAPICLLKSKIGCIDLMTGAIEVVKPSQMPAKIDFNGIQCFLITIEIPIIAAVTPAIAKPTGFIKKATDNDFKAMIAAGIVFVAKAPKARLIVEIDFKGFFANATIAAPADAIPFLF